MLVLERRLGESIHIGPDITVSIERIRSDRVRIGIDAPKELIIVRSELKENRNKCKGRES